MGRIHLLLATIVALTFHANGQGLFLEVHGTHQFPIGGLTEVRGNWTDVNDTTRIADYHRVNLNLGAGSGIGMVVGLGLGDRLGIELRTTWFPACRTEWKNTSRGGGSDRSVLSRFLQLQPAIRLSSGEGRFSWHLVTGPTVVIAAQSISRIEARFTYQVTEEVYAIEWTESGRVGLGGFVGVGAQYSPFRSWGFFGEVNCTAQSWSPRRGKRTEHTVNGVDRLPSSSTSFLETEYVDTYRTPEETDPDQPEKQLRFHYPMSTWGIRIGVRYAFNRPKA